MNEVYIKQIIPAPNNLFVIYEDDEGEFESKVICLALLNTDEVVMMDSDDIGQIQMAERFKHVIYK